jgi:hypothetical protein
MEVMSGIGQDGATQVLLNTMNNSPTGLPSTHDWLIAVCWKEKKYNHNLELFMVVGYQVGLSDPLKATQITLN